MRYNPLLIILFNCLNITNSHAAEFNATPTNYRSKLALLKAGDTLTLAAGYYPLLPLASLQGTAERWITVQGSRGAVIGVNPENPTCCNLVQLENQNAYLALKDLRIDSGGQPFVNGIESRGATHHILIEHCSFVGQNVDQNNVAISTKGMAWDWTIRGNTIFGAGTGLYLGNSDGRFPFIHGLIEQNYIADTLGYNLQIKWSVPYELPAGLTAAALQTVIRHNVFIKSQAARQFPKGMTLGARPNLLVGGSSNNAALYDIYGNVFVENRDHEALFQGSGRVRFHDNLLLGGERVAALFQNHDLPLKLAQVFANRIYTRGWGIVVRDAPDSLVNGNVIFADGGVIAPIKADNVLAALSAAKLHEVLAFLQQREFAWLSADNRQHLTALVQQFWADLLHH